MIVIENIPDTNASNRALHFTVEITQLSNEMRGCKLHLLGCHG